MAGERQARIRFYAAKRRRVNDPPWLPNGEFPLDWLIDGAPEVFDPSSREHVAASFPGLNNLDRSIGGDAYLELEPGNEDSDVIVASPPVVDPKFVALRFWKGRRANLPSVLSLADGSTNPVSLGDSDVIAEAVDLVIFRDSGIAGWLVNRPGPSKTEVLNYIEERSGVSLDLPPLTREDALALVRPEEFTFVEVEMEIGVGGDDEASALLDGLGDVASAFDSSGNGFKRVAVKLLVDADHRVSTWSRLKSRLGGLVEHRPSSVRKVAVGQAGSDERSQRAIDLIEDSIVFEQPVPLHAGRTVDADAAINAILHGHDAFAENLRAATQRMNLKDENTRGRRKRGSTSSAVTPEDENES